MVPALMRTTMAMPTVTALTDHRRQPRPPRPRLTTTARLADLFRLQSVTIPRDQLISIRSGSPASPLFGPAWFATATRSGQKHSGYARSPAIIRPADVKDCQSDTIASATHKLVSLHGSRAQPTGTESVLSFIGSTRPARTESDRISSSESLPGADWRSLHYESSSFC